MNELIKIEINNGKRVVSARELHEFLSVGRDFTTWIKGRIDKYEFEENADFTIVNLAHQNGGASWGGQNKLDYAITIDMAKELCMVENNELGRKARRYFIQCEKKLQEIAIKQDSYMIDDPVGRAERWIEEEKERQSLRSDNEKLMKEVRSIKEACERVLGFDMQNEYEIVPDSEPLKPRRYRRRVLCDGKVYVSIKECAKHLGIGYTTLRTYLTGSRKLPKHLRDIEVRYID